MRLGEIGHFQLAQHVPDDMFRHAIGPGGIPAQDHVQWSVKIDETDSGVIGGKEVNQLAAQQPGNIRGVPDKRLPSA